MFEVDRAALTSRLVNAVGCRLQVVLCLDETSSPDGQEVVSFVRRQNQESFLWMLSMRSHVKNCATTLCWMALASPKKN